MSGRTRHTPIDANQPEIVRRLRAAGVKVCLIGKPLDLLCARGGRWIMLEVKNPNVNPPADAIGVKATRPGGEWHDLEILFPGRARYLRESQAKFIREFHAEGGKIAIVFDADEALEACGVTS